MEGRHCRLEPLAADHVPDLWYAVSHDTAHRNWTYLAYGPFASMDEYAAWVASVASLADPMFFAVATPTGGAQGGPGVTGVASYLRIAPEAGSIEVGHINFSPLLQQTPASTEAMYLMMKRA